MPPERPECQCLACAQLQHHQANDTLLLVAIATVLVVGGLVWLTGQLAGLLSAGAWPDVPLGGLPRILARLREHPGDPAAAWPASVRDGLPGPLGMYATLAGILATPLALGVLAASHPRRPGPACLATGRASGRADAPAPGAEGGAVTATTLRAQQTMLAGLGRSGGDAQEWAATNPVAALPCAWTPLPNPLSTPLLIPLLIPPSATVGVNSPTTAPFRQVRGTDPGQSRAKTARDWPGSRWSQKQWRATRSRLHAGAVVSGQPPTNGVGGLPPGSRRHRHDSGHARWSHG